ncbi:MAG: 50S ribosomal protein L3 N(5)-glutamine methyltransferase [Kangiellaceae bacterium]|nr:50S ribosomal protein L3 N(5)-glutamine methyltransferase [Kangiellaceae bacterium]
MSHFIRASLIEEDTIKQAIAELVSIQDFIRWACSQFESSDIYYGHGTDNAWSESVMLVLQSVNLPFDTPDIVLQSRLTTTEKRLIATRIAKRINQKIPVAYLTNKAMFCESEYYVDSRVLVPRSPIAELIENRFEPWVNSDKVENILDLCTGSGCIAIACSQYFPDAIVDGSDISSDCIEVAEINRENLQQDNVAFYQSDLFQQLEDKKYDIIVSNPPYVDEEDFSEIPAEFLAEPKLGLISGGDGLDLTHKILAEACQYLNDDGILIVEVGNSAQALEQVYPKAEFLWLEFERGGHGVFLLNKKQLKAMGSDEKN